MNKPLKIAIAVSSALIAMSTQAAEWSDTSIGIRTGSQFQEPFNGKSISKTIYNFKHVSGYKYGTNFFNADLLQSDSTDSNAQEVYVVYRNTVDLGKATGKSFAFGPFRGTGITAGFDWNTKNDVGYQSKKRMFVVGPTLMVDVPGFLDVSLLLLAESNFPKGIVSRYSYKTHPMLTAAWGIPVGGAGLSFEGFINVIASKGKDEFAGNTATETNLDAALMYDIGAPMGAGKNTFKVGIGYQYWKNKFGNLSSVPGSLAKTTMLKAEYHF